MQASADVTHILLTKTLLPLGSYYLKEMMYSSTKPAIVLIIKSSNVTIMVKSIYQYYPHDVECAQDW